MKSHKELLLESASFHLEEKINWEIYNLLHINKFSLLFLVSV